MVSSRLSDLEQDQSFQAWQTELAHAFSAAAMTVRVAWAKTTLYILLEAEQVPSQSEVLLRVRQLLQVEAVRRVQTCRVYGRQVGDTFTAWMVEIDVVSLFKDPLDSLTQQDLTHPSSFFALTSDSLVQADDRTLSDDSQSLATIAPARSRSDHFIVCGLGRLGQHCVRSLKSFAQQAVEIQVTAIDRQQPDHWEVDQLSDWLSAAMITGDCRQDAVLQQAGIADCRAIVIVTQDENTNIETAIAARRLNPHVRLIVRSGKQNLNELLKQRLGNFAAFEPIELPAESFVLAALGDETLGLFKIGDRQLRVVQHQVQPQDGQFTNLPIHKLYKDSCRLLKYSSTLESPPTLSRSSGRTVSILPPTAEADAIAAERIFYQWSPTAQIQPGDTLFYIEAVERPGTPQLPTTPPQWSQWRQRLQRFIQGNWRQGGQQFWRWVKGDRTRRVTSLGFFIAFLLGILGAVLLRFTVEGMTWQEAISSAVILLLGGYGDVFGGLALSTTVPWWVQAICLLITAASILFFLSVLGLLADRLLSARFEFLQRRPPVPRSQHVVLVGLGRVGQRIATLLQDAHQPFVCLTHSKEHEDLLPQVPLVSSPILPGLDAVNLGQAKSLIVATDDQMLNLEVALTARNAAAQCDRTLNLVIRAQDQRFCDHLTGLMPDAKALCVYALTADAFAGAAFGENILHLFQVANETILVTEYHIEATDTLQGKLLAQIAYGYGVVPIAYQALPDSTWKLLPSDNVRLQVGDRLIVLATLNGLQRIEWGTLTPPRRWQLQALKPLDSKVTFYAGNTLENISGCALSDARQFMDNLPQTLDVPNVMTLDLYDHQADHLLRKLRKLLPVRLIPLT